MRSLVALGALGVAGLLWTGVGAQVYRQPDAGTGLVTVAGGVEITNTPTVKATQLGEWKVAIANAPDVHVSNTASVRMPPPEFLKARTRYEVVWPNGERESVLFEETGRDGWVRVDDRRWINVAAARSLEAKP